jgi:hypothetical protein
MITKVLRIADGIFVPYWIDRDGDRPNVRIWDRGYRDKPTAELAVWDAWKHERRPDGGIVLDDDLMRQAVYVAASKIAE